MNEAEEFYLQHYGVKGMKWGVRRKKRSSEKATRKQAKKANKVLYKEAKGDIKNWNRAKSAHNYKRVGIVNGEIGRKRVNKKGYDQAYEKARKSHNRKARALQSAAIANMALSVAYAANPEAVYKGAGVVGAVLGNTASATGTYAKYAAKAAVPVSRTVKNRGYIDAILVNSGNAVSVSR